MPLEEPELSLHLSVVRQLPAILSRVRRAGGSQVLLTTHSEEVLQDPGLGKDEVYFFVPATRALKPRRRLRFRISSRSWIQG